MRSGRMRFGLVTNTLVLDTNALKMHVQSARNRLAEQSFGMFHIHKDRILFELFLWKEKEERKKKKEVEQNRNFQVWFS